MKLPRPPLPKWYWKLSFQNRLRFCKYYWNPWWNVKNVFDLWAWKHNRQSKNRTAIPNEDKAATPTREKGEKW